MRARERGGGLLLTWSGAGEGQEQRASLARSSGASRHLLPLRRRRAVWPALIRRFAPPSPASQEKGCLAGPQPALRATFSRFAGEGLSGRPSSGALRHLLPLRRGRAVWPALIRRFAHLPSPKAATRSAD